MGTQHRLPKGFPRYIWRGSLRGKMVEHRGHPGARASRPLGCTVELLSGNSSQPSATTTSGTTSTTLQASAGATTTTTGASAAQATTYSPWSSVVAYPGGSRVIYQGLVYQAKWWNEGEVPTVDVAHPWDTPWEPVGTAWPAG